ncbi:MAG TPA: protein kinase [Gemmatales bacterium]|nr:protein kinase [Gemmatales bacterium]
MSTFQALLLWHELGYWSLQPNVLSGKIESLSGEWLAMRRYEAGQEVVSGVKIISHIGAGGFGTVYKVSVPGGVEKALKIINLQGTQGVREYNALKLIKRISHPNLVSIDSYWLRDLQGKLIDFSSDDSINAEKQSLELIILMGLGRMSLHDLLMQYLKEGKPGIPFDELIRLMSATAEAIDYLNEPHNLGLKEPIAIQHGDIKPGNILLVGNSVQVCDYGLAKAIIPSKNARTSIPLFSPGYCSPEMNNNQPSYWSDQFSLAISYYELRTGNLPFNEDEASNAGMEAVLGKLDFSGVPKAEREVLLKAANPIPNQRYPKCTDLINALRATAYSSPRDSGPKPRSLEEILQPDSYVVPGYKLVNRISQGERDEFWKATTSAGKPFIIYVIREFRGALGNQLLQSLEFLRRLDEHENLINLRDSWMIHSDGSVTTYIDAGGLENQTVALVSLLDNVDCTLEDYYNECLKRRQSEGILSHELIDFMTQAGEAVDYLTQLGYTDFLDLKPQTILLTKNKKVKLGIAGLAKRLMCGSSALTTDRLVNAFAPPELFDFEGGKHSNSNQYSLALTYYWLRSLGHLPFSANSTPKQIRECHLHGQLDFMDVPEPEQDILFEATALNPNQRFGNCGQFVEAMKLAMGGTVPVYEERQPPLRNTPRPTPKPTDPAAKAEHQSDPVERPTDHVERPQRITPLILPQQKTPQTPAARRSDPYTTIQNMPALPQDFGYEETTEHTPYLEPVPHAAGLLQTVPVPKPPEASKENEEPEEDYRDVFRKTNADKKQRRRRRAISIVGGLIISVVGALAFWKFVIDKTDKTGPIASNSSTITEPTVTQPTKGTQSTTVVPLTPAQWTAKVDDLVNKEDYRGAWVQIAQAKQDATWEKDQQKKVRDRLAFKLNAEIQTLLNNKDFEKADKTASDQASKYRELLPISWVKERLAFIKWAAIKSNVNGLNKDKLDTFQADLQRFVDEVPSTAAERHEANDLLGAVKGLIELRKAPLTDEPTSLQTRLTEFNNWKAKWKQKVNVDLQAAGCATEVHNEVLQKAKESLMKVKTPKNLLDFAPLLEMLYTVADKDNSGWITAGRLEIAAQDESRSTDGVRNEAKEFTPKTPYDHFAQAALLSHETSLETLQRWQKVFPDTGNWSTEIIVPFRMQFAEKSVQAILDQCRASKTDRCVFIPEKTNQALQAINLLMLIKTPKMQDEILLAEKAILEDMKDPLAGSLEAFQLLPVYKELPDRVKKEIKTRLLKRVLPDNANMAAKIDRVRLLLDSFHDEQGVTEEELIENAIIRLQFDQFATWKESIPNSHRAILANILSELGEDMFFNKSAWSAILETKSIRSDIVQQMMSAAIQLDPQGDVHYLRNVITIYERNNERINNQWSELAKQWIKYSETMEGHVAKHFGTPLIKGIVEYVNVCRESIGFSIREKLIGRLTAADEYYKSASELIEKSDIRYRSQYRFIIAIDRSNIALRIANLQFEPKEQRKFLDLAFNHATSAKKIFKNHPEASDNMGVVLEDYAWLLDEEIKYSNAVDEFTKAIGDLGGALRNKPLLHRARCYYKWGKATRDGNLLNKALQDFENFLAKSHEPMTYRIEALYYRAFTYFEQSVMHKEGTAEYAKPRTMGVTDLKEALRLVTLHSDLVWNRKVSFALFDKANADIYQVIAKPGFDFGSLQKNPVFIDRMAQFELIKQLNSDYDSFKQLIDAYILEYNVKEEQEGIAKVAALFEITIDLSKQGTAPDLEIFTRACKAKIRLDVAEGKLESALNRAIEGHKISIKYHMARSVSLEFMELIMSREFGLFNKTSESKYWIDARNHLLEVLREYPGIIDEQKYATSVIGLLAQSPSADKESNIKQTLDSLEGISKTSLAKFRPKYVKLYELVKAGTKDLGKTP